MHPGRAGLENIRVDEQVRFLPLAIAEMEGEGVCIAGVDVGTRWWVRPVVPGKRRVFSEHASQFVPNHMHDMLVGGVQPRRAQDDPLGHHSEDRVLVEVRGRSGPVSPSEKLRILDGACDRDLASSLRTGRRSLFLVQPRSFSYGMDEFGAPRFRFESTVPATRQPGSNSSLEAGRIAISTRGPKCTCPRWVDFAVGRWGRLVVDERLLQNACPGARIYLALSLSALYEEKYWLIVAGVHVVGEDQIWL